MTEAAQKWENNAIFFCHRKAKLYPKLFIAFKIAYSRCFILGKSRISS